MYDNTLTSRQLAKSIVPHPVADNTYVAAVNAVVSVRAFAL